MAIEVNSIQIPSEYVDLASQWYGGQGCILYAVASTGNLTTGTQRPFNDDDEPASDQEWYVSLWDELDCGLSRLLRSIKPDHEDYDTLKAFQEYAETTSDQLRQQYGLDD